MKAIATPLNATGSPLECAVRFTHKTWKRLRTLSRRRVVVLLFASFALALLYALSSDRRPNSFASIGGLVLDYRHVLHRRYSHVLVNQCSFSKPIPVGATTTTAVRGVDVKYLSWAENETELHHKIRAYPPVRIMSKFTRPATLLDVGANIGKIAFPAFALSGPHTVIAVEPVEKNIRTLCMTAALNSWLSHPGLFLVHAAMSDADGTMEIFVPEGREDNSALSSTASTANVHVPKRGERIRTISGDGLLAAGDFRPDVIKIDTQGHEIHVLRGLRNYLKASNNVLVIAESDPKLMKMSNVNPADVYHLMVTELGYTPFSTVDVSVVDDVLKLSGDVIPQEIYPTRTARDIFYFKTHG